MRHDPHRFFLPKVGRFADTQGASGLLKPAFNSFREIGDLSSRHDDLSIIDKALLIDLWPEGEGEESHDDLLIKLLSVVEDERILFSRRALKELTFELLSSSSSSGISERESRESTSNPSELVFEVCLLQGDLCSSARPSLLGEQPARISSIELSASHLDFFLCLSSSRG